MPIEKLFDALRNHKIYRDAPINAVTYFDDTLVRWVAIAEEDHVHFDITFGELAQSLNELLVTTLGIRTIFKQRIWSFTEVVVDCTKMRIIFPRDGVCIDILPGPVDVTLLEKACLGSAHSDDPFSCLVTPDIVVCVMCAKGALFPTPEPTTVDDFIMAAKSYTSPVFKCLSTRLEESDV